MHDAGVTRARQRIAEPGGELRHERELARGVVLPERAEAADLALEVAVGAAEVGQARARDVHRVQLHQRVDEVATSPPARIAATQRRRQLVCHDVTAQLLHEVERHAEHLVAGADGEHARHARAALQRRQDARLAQHVVCRGRQRWARRPAQHHARALALEQERRVRVARADARDLEHTPTQALLVEPRLQRAPDDQRRQRQRRCLGRCVDDVDGAVHRSRWRRRAARRAIDQRCVSLGPS